MLTVDVDKLNLKPGSRVLDAGCGTGRHLCEAFRSRGIDVVGIDVNREDLGKARGLLCLMGSEGMGSWLTAAADITKLPFRDEVFDAVICSEVLEHIYDVAAAISELVRVLKPGKNLAVSVPSFWPERICWAISESYRSEPGGHIRIYKKKSLQKLLENAGTTCWKISYKHALHAPYWWLRCIVGHKNEHARIVNIYRKFLEWDILRHPPLVGILDRMLNLFIAKSVVFYLKKG